MLFTGFDNNGWWLFFAYVLIVPLINVLVTPALLIGVAQGRLKPIIWRKYLIANGLFHVFAIWAPYIVILDLISKIEYKVSLYRHIPASLMFFGIMFQGIFFLIWLANRLRKNELHDSYYKIWGIGFICLYLLPFVIHMLIGFINWGHT